MTDTAVLTAQYGAQLVDRILDRAADALGDLTPQVMARYYAAIPQAMQRFEFHQPVRREKLEGEMIEQALYCLMRWHSDRSEIEIVLATTVPHHLYALDIPLDQFTGMMDAVCETVAATIPAGEADELQCWQDLHREMTRFMLENT
jgi:hypothetical protein